MRKKFLLMIFVLSLFTSMGGGWLHAQTKNGVSSTSAKTITLFEDGFEDDFTSLDEEFWTQKDANVDGKKWYYVLEKNKDGSIKRQFIISKSYDGGAIDPEDYIVTTSSYTLSESSVLTLQIGPNGNYNNNAYKVVISEDMTNWITVYEEYFRDDDKNINITSIQTRTIPLSDYSGQTVHVGVLHFYGHPDDGSGVIIDYIKLTGVAAPAADVAKIGDVEYETLEDAIAAAQNGETITLVADVELTAQVVIPEGKVLTLDLNGKTVNSVFNGTSTTNHIYALSNKGTLTINDSEGNGSINSRGIYNYGSLTLNAGAINAIDGNGGYAVNNQNGSTFVMNGGVVAASYEDDYQSSSGGYDATALKVPAGCTATLNGGTINNVCDFTYAIDATGTLNIPATSTITVNGTHGAIAVSGGETTIDAGTFQIPADEYSRTDNVLYVSGGSLVVNGGTFIGDSDTASGGSCLYDAAGKAVVNGGTFKGSSGGDVWGTTGTTIKGGTFENLTEKQHIAAGYELGADGTVAAKSVAEVNGVKYTSFAAAIEAATNGQTITLIDNVVLAEVVTIPADKTLTIDLNGMAISMQESIITTAYAINNLGNLTITDGVGGGSVNARGIYNGYGNGGDNVASATITVLGGTFNAKGTNGGAAIFNYGTANVNGGTFTSIGGYSLNNQNGASMTIADGVSVTGGIYNNSNAELTVNGGNISNNRSSCHTIYAWNAEVIVNGGSIHNENSGNATIMSAGTSEVTINGGTISIKDGRVPGNGNTWTSCLTDAANTAKIIVNDGTFNGGVRVQGGATMTINGGSFNDVTGSGYNVYTGATVEVKGGTFTDAAAQTFAKNNIADDYKLGEDGKVVYVPVVAKIGETKYETLDAAVAAAKEGDKIQLLADADLVFAHNPQYNNVYASEIDLNGKTMTIKKGDVRFDKVTIKNGNIVVEPGTYNGTAIFLMYSKNLTFDAVKVTATGVASTYLIGLEGTSNLKLENNSEIVINNESLVNIGSIIADNGNGNTVTIKDSKIEITNSNARLYLGGTNGNITVENSDIDLNRVKDGFYLRAGQTLAITGTSTVDITLITNEGRYGINLTDITATYTKAETATVNATLKEITPVAVIGTQKFASLQAAIDAAILMTGDVTIEIMSGTYAQDINLTNAAVTAGNANARPNITFKPAADADVTFAGTTTLGYRVQNVGASMWQGEVIFEGIKFNHAENGKHSLDIQDVKGITLLNCTVTGDGEYGIGSNGSNATPKAAFTNCTFENGAMQVLGQLSANLVIDNSTFNNFSINAQGGTTPGLTIKNSIFNMTLTDAHVGQSFYVVRSNANPINIQNTKVNVDSEVSSVTADQAKWGLFWARQDANAKWNIDACEVNLTDAAMAQTELLFTKNAATTYDKAKERIVITNLTSASNNVADLVKRAEGCATVNNVKYLDGELDLTGLVAKVGDAYYATISKAVAAVEDGGTITLIANETFTENNRYNNGGWWDGLGYSGDKSFTIDLAGRTISQNGALNDYLMWFKNDGAKANTITLKNGTLDAGTTAFCALATASSNAQKITVNLENINLINNNSNGATLKIRGGAELNVKAGTVITGKDSYLGIEAVGSTTVVNIYEGAEIYQNGTSSYCGCLAGASGKGTINVYGGKGQSKSGGFIAMTSGGTINIEGGEWTANTDGTYANGNKSVLVAQSDKQYNAGAGNSIVNVTGGTFKGGYNCYGNAVGDAQINISGGNFNANPTSYVAESYVAVENNGVWNVVKAAAKIGTSYYASLQAAIEAAIEAANNNDVIILLKEGLADNVTVSQTPDVKFTIDGAGLTFKGTITVDGKSAAYATAGLTIKNVNFDATNISKDACINLGGNNSIRYTNNVTVENCTFTGTDKAKVGVKNYTGGCKNVTIKNCTATGLHSLAQLKTSTTVTLAENTVTESKNGVSLGSSTGVTVTECTFTVDGYGIRPDGGASVTITDSNISAFIPVVVRNASADASLTFNGTNNTMTATNGDSVWCVIGTSEYETNGQLPTDATAKVVVDLSESNLTYEGVYGNYAVAKIGEVQYASLQAAIEAAIEAANNNDVITLLKEGLTENVTVAQKPDVKFTIDGAEKTFKGTITIDGKSAAYATAGLTIKNVKFDATAITKDACINLGVSGNNNTRYTNNVTVSGCTFTDGDYTAVAVKSYTGGDKNLVIEDCIATGMHSLAQLSNVKEGLVISGCDVDTKNGLNLGSSGETGEVVIVNNNISVKGYAVRIGAGNGGNSGEITLTNNTLKTDNTEGDAVIVVRGAAVEQVDLTMTKNIVSGDTHISGNTTATQISADANYWDGATAPVTSGTEVAVNSYYKDEALQQLVRIEKGSIYAHVYADRIFGDVTTNAAETLVVEIIGADGTVIGTSTLEKPEHRDGTMKTLTWRINFGADDSGSWAMQWNEGAPSINNIPTKVKVIVDGKEMAEAPIKYTANGDGQSPVVAAKNAADGKFSFVVAEGKFNLDTAAETLNAAIAAGDNVAILAAGTYKVPTGKDLTITGAVEGVEFANIGAHNMGGANVTFNNVTFTYASNSTYKGLQHSGNLVYNNCTFNGQVFLYGQSETFNNCTFNTTDSNNYNVWTYGAKNVAFNECTFNSAGKSVLIYAESASVTNNVSVAKCQFIASQAVEGKAAIEMDSSLTGGINLTIDAETTASGFGEGNVSGNSLWNNKKGNNDAKNNDITVVVNGETVLAPIFEAQIGDVQYRNLQDAINAVQNGETITVLRDIATNVEIKEKDNVKVTIDGNGMKMTGTIKVVALSSDNDRRITIKNFKFEDTTSASVDFITSVEKNHYPRITVEGCTFTGSGDATDVALRLKSSKNVEIKNCTGTGLHSFLQNTSGWNLTIEDVTVTNSKSGLALGTVQGVTVKGCNIDVPGYGIRLDAGYNNNAVIESNTVEAFIPVVVRNANKDSNITFNGTNTMTAANDDNVWCVIGTSEYEENGKLPTPATAKVVVDLSESNLTYEGVYGNYAVAKIGEVQYASLQAAIEDAQNGETVILFADTDEVVSVNVLNKKISIVGEEDLFPVLKGGLDFGIDNHSQDAGNITIKGIKFVGNGIKIDDMASVTIEGNIFENITASNAIYVAADEYTTTLAITNNIIRNVAGAGINLRNPINATVTGNTITNVTGNAMTFQNNGAIEDIAGEIVIKGNVLTDWAYGKTEGRAIRLALGNIADNVIIEENAMIAANAPEEFVKISGTSNAEISVDENYWNGVAPTAAHFLAEGVKIHNYYASYDAQTNTLSNLVTIAGETLEIYYTAAGVETTKDQAAYSLSFAITDYVNKEASIKIGSKKPTTKDRIEIVTPATVAFEGVEYNVTSLANKAFDGVRGIKELIISEGVKSFGSRALANMYELVNVVFPSSLVSVGDQCFTGYGDNHKIKTITCLAGDPPTASGNWQTASFQMWVAENVILFVAGDANVYKKAAGWSRFTNILGINSEIEIPGNYYLYTMKVNVTSVSPRAASIKIGRRFPEGVPAILDTIPETASFYGIEFPITSIPEKGFQGVKFEKIVIPGNIKNIGNTAFGGSNLADTLIIEEGVETLGNFAFQGCYSLSEIILPSTLKSVGEKCFYNVGVATSNQAAVEVSLVYTGVTPPTAGANIFSNNIQGTLYVPTLEVVESFKAAAGWNISSIKPFEAKIGETVYYSLAKAIKASKAGDVITLIADVETAKANPIIIPEGVTLDINTHDITANIYGTVKTAGGLWTTVAVPGFNSRDMLGEGAIYNTTDATVVNLANEVNVLAGTIVLNPHPETEWWTLPGQSLSIATGATFEIPSGVKFTVREGNANVNGTLINNGTLAINAGATVTGNLTGDIHFLGGNFITADGYKMVGTTSEYFYNATNALVNIESTFGDITILSGAMTLGQSWRTVQGQTLTVAEGASFTVPTGMTFDVLANTHVVVEGTVINNGTLAINAGATVTGNLTGDIHFLGGNFITADGYKMVGTTSEYFYNATNALVNIESTFGDITILSGAMTLGQSWRTVQGQTLTVAEGASFTVPTGMTFEVFANTHVVVEGTLVTDGTVYLQAGATVRAEAGLDIQTTVAGHVVDYNNGVYSVIPIYTQTIQLKAGWNWSSSYVETDLESLQAALGTSGVKIKDDNLYTDYYAEYDEWYGSLNSYSYNKMYMIKATEDIEISISGNLINTNDIEITLVPGWNWISYPNSESVDINIALQNLDSQEGDKIKSDSPYADYYEGYGWYGSLNTLEPGVGYMYYNSSNLTKTFTYSTSTRRSEAKANVTTEGNYWTPNAAQFANNMTMTAVLDVENINYEVAAFVNGECRGSARPIYVEALDAYMLFLTIHGEEVEEMTFKYYDIDTDIEYTLSDRINYSNNAILGSLKEPYMFTRGTTGIGEAELSQLNIYPNPTTTAAEINLNATFDKVEVFNALGVKVAEYSNVDSIDALETAGIYVIRATNNSVISHCRLVVK